MFEPVKGKKMIMQEGQDQKKQGQAGFSLLELLLAIGAFAVLSIVIINIIDDWTDRLRDGRSAKHILLVQKSAEEYVSANFMSFYNDTGVGGVLVFDIEDTGGTYFLKDGSTFINDDFSDVNAYNQKARIAVRNLGEATGEKTLAVLTFTERTRIADNRLRSIAQMAGPDVGFISAINLPGGGCCAGTIQSGSGGWSVPMADYAGVVTDAPNIADGGFIAAYGTIRFSEAFNSQYLYRIAITGQPEINRMATNLDMNGNDIQNINVLGVDAVHVAGNIDIQGFGPGGAGVSPQALLVDQVVDVGGDSNRVDGNMLINGDGDALTNDLVVLNNINVSNQVIANDIVVDTLTAGSGFVGDVLAVPTNVATGSVNASEVQVSAAVNSEKLQLPALDAASGVTAVSTGSMDAVSLRSENINSSSLRVSGNIAVPGNTTITGNVLPVGELYVGDLIFCQRADLGAYNGNNCMPP